MVSDIKLDGNSVIIETDDNAKGNKLILDDVCLKGQVFDFDLDHPDRRDPNAPPNPRRRALVHGPGDKLVLNWDGDYPGGVEIVGKVNIQNPILGKISDLTVINNLTVENANNDGITVVKAVHAGLDVLESDGFGVLVEKAANGISVQNVAGNGFQVDDAGNTGLYIHKSGGIGVLVDESASGVSVQNVVGNGFQVDDAGDNGLSINKSQNNGVDIEEVGNDFFIAGPQSDRKFRVRQNGIVNCKIGCSVLPGYAELVVTESGSLTGYTPGDVLQISDIKDRAVELANTPYSWKVAGIYADKSGILGSNHPMDDIQMGAIPMAVTGIVPCKVSALNYPAGNGHIKRGDLLTTSSTPGHAMKVTQYKAGAILGKAFGELPNGTGMIDVLVNLQ